MSLWVPVLVVSLLALMGGMAALWVRQRRRNRLQLRVLAGRRRLLGEEIETRLESLPASPVQDTEALRAAAQGLLDGIHAGLVDREAHLQNLHDLARLQRHKLTVLARQRQAAHLATATGTPPTPATATPAEDGEPHDGGDIVERREQLEDRLLEHLQKRGDTPPPRRRRRRR